MELSEFEELVHEGFEAIPEKFRKLVDNVAIIVEDEPTPEVLRAQGLGDNQTLLGLYVGVPRIKRGIHYGVGGTLPDIITIYRLPILRAAGGSRIRVREIVRDTVWHEIAHHFGMDEEFVRRREKERKRQGY